ncbi:MAG: hypothetical protein JSR46_06295 [Verrucomicrobia bacterium]|nr:hypothetical protein [Verrucomicrobiota bacterium]
MATSKPIRSMGKAAEAQERVETATTVDKFEETKDLAQPPTPTPSTPKPMIGRLSPQLSCTISQEDKEKLTALTLRLSMRKGKALNTSTIIRALIRIGEKYEEELEI